MSAGNSFTVEVSAGPASDTSSRVLARVGAVALTGLAGAMVTAEAVVAGGLPQIRIVGLPDATVREAADRIRSACQQSAFSLPGAKVVVNLAPAGIRKVGSGFDLPIALAVLCAAGHIPPDRLDGIVAWGEVGLDGGVSPSAGTLPVATAARRNGAGRLMVASQALAEAALVAGLDVVGVDSLRDAVAVAAGHRSGARPGPVAVSHSPHGPDLAAVRGQHVARRCLELAAVGGHHMLMVGPPGCGKSMLARRLPSILPPLAHEEALEVAAIRSIMGERVRLDLRPPFRDPHHATSTAGLIGGGSGVARPGEVSRAHRGVLFLDEVLETPRATLDALREPLETGRVVLVRSQSRVTYPAAVQLVAAANPCPCGRAGAAGRPCTCRPDQVARHRSRLSGPLLDRIDLHLAMEPVSQDVLVGPSSGESSDVVAARVVAARALATSRWSEFGAQPSGPRARMLTRDVSSDAVRASTGRPAQRRLARAIEAFGWSARAFDRCLRVARTIADVDGRDRVEPADVDEAVAHRVDLDGPS